MAAEFQFTLPCRERRSAGGSRCTPLTFQFTLPCRERPSLSGFAERETCFNSRSRVGSDSRTSSNRRQRRLFQFTLPCRERHAGGVGGVNEGVFQFTLPCRERLNAKMQALKEGVSIHAPV